MTAGEGGGGGGGVPGTQGTPPAYGPGMVWETVDLRSRAQYY